MYKFRVFKSMLTSDLINSMLNFHEFCFCLFILQAWRMVPNDNTSIAMDDRSEKIESTQQLRTMVVPKENGKRPAAMQSIE